MPAADQLAVAVPVTTLWEGPDAVRPVDAPMLVDRPDPRAWSAALAVSDRHDLGRVLTQLLLGEPVQVVESDGGWVKVVAPWQPSGLDPRGYPGWIPRAHLARPAAPTGNEAVVTADTTTLHSDADGRHAFGEATYATVLAVAGVGDVRGPAGTVAVTLPGGETAWLDRSACEVRESPVNRAGGVVDPDVAVAEARRFVGLQYLWGGLSAYGLDCSGLVHITYRRLGAVIPRDAHDQAAAGTHVPRERARLGDLLFYARPGTGIHHVGFALDDAARILHAPGTGKAVVDEPMNDDRRATVLDFVARLG